MKKTLFIGLMLLLTLTVGAQKANQARATLDKVAQVIGHKGGATANFSMSGKYGNSNGTLSIKGNKFVAKTSQAIIWFDGKTQWTYNLQAEEVNISTPNDNQQQAMNPYNFLNLYKKGYDLSMSKQNQVHLKAQNDNKTLKELYITVDKNYHPTQVKMRTAKGWTVFDITNFKAQNLADNAFRFNAKDYPQAEVIDLR